MLGRLLRPVHLSKRQAILTAGFAAGLALVSPLISVNAMGSAQALSVTRTTRTPVSGTECADLQSKHLSCYIITTVSMQGTFTAPRVAINSTYANPNYACSVDSCNGGQGNLNTTGASCGTSFTGSGWTEVTDASGGYLWHSKVNYLWHGVLCQNIYYDSVDCGDSSGNGYSVSVTWCSSFNNGAGAPYNYTDAGDDFTVSAFFQGFPFSASHGQRLSQDVYANYGITYW